MSKHRLLLADDSITIQKVVNLTFADEGIEVVTAGDGNTAMEKFVESMPDLVMVDVNMPGLDGYRICEMIKQDEETKHIPVILLFGSFEPFDKEEARRVGADDYLTKPFQSIRQLVSKVSDLLNRTNGGTSAKPAVIIAENTETAVASGFGNFSETANKSDFAKFGDAGLDDDLIQTNQIGSLPVNESQKFISEPNVQKPADAFAAAWQTEAETARAAESLPVEDFELMRLDSDETELSKPDETVYEFADESSSNRETEPEILEWQASKETNESEYKMDNAELNMKTPAQDDFSFDLDDFNFLELPPLAKKPLPKTESPAAEEKTFEKVEEKSAEKELDLKSSAQEKATTKAVQKSDAPQMNEFSPEVIEAITKRIMEKLSEKVVAEIAREMTPQMTRSIIEELTRNKTN